jgi:hypothetical protein
MAWMLYTVKEIKMPLIKGAKPNSKGFKENIKEMFESGHPLKQSVAAAYSAAKESKPKTKKGKRK